MSSQPTTHPTPTEPASGPDPVMLTALTAAHVAAAHVIAITPVLPYIVELARSSGESYEVRVYVHQDIPGVHALAAALNAAVTQRRHSPGRTYTTALAEIRGVQVEVWTLTDDAPEGGAPAAAQVDDPSGRLAEQRHQLEDPATEAAFAALAADHPEACTGPPAVTPVQMEALHRLHANNPGGGLFYRSPRTRDALEHLGLIAYHPAQGWDLTARGRELVGGGLYYPDNGATGTCRNGQPVRWICGTNGRGPGAWWHADGDRCTATPEGTEGGER